MNDTHIEISNQDAPPALREALDTAYVKRDEAHANAEQAAATLTRAQRVKTTADERVQQLEKSLETAEAEQAYRLEAQITAGAPTDAFPPNLSAESIAETLRAARVQASITTKALESIKAAHAQRLAELGAADRAVVAAVDAILDEERIDLAKQLQCHLDEAVRLGKSLLFEAIAEEMTTRRQPPEQVKATLTRLELPLIDRLNVATSIWRTGDQTALARRAARRAEMISGESAPVADAAA